MSIEIPWDIEGLNQVGKTGNASFDVLASISFNIDDGHWGRPK